MLDDARHSIRDLAENVGEWVGTRLDDAGTFLRDHFESFENWISSLTVLEWVLLGLALGLILWVVAKVQAATTLGPIEVAPIEPASGDAALHELTAELRQCIDEVGLRPPPDVPVGAPQANLLTAIEKSPIPQANWIATLLQAMPRPRPVTYKLATTQLASGNGVAFSLRPSGSGASLFDTASGENTAALREVARRVLMHVSKDAVDIFPPWTRWDDQSALTAYLNGMDAAQGAHYNTARVCFQDAIDEQPDNAVARLRWLNAREARARIKPRTLNDQVLLLRDYLALAIQRPELVEARYRCATLAMVLADAHRNDTSKIGPGVLDLTVDELRDIGRRGLRQALTQLRPWFVPLFWHRPRYAVEPRGHERRRLKRTLAISKRCQLARKHRNWKGPGRWMSSWMVRLWCDRSSADWQVHYNAACFFALIGEREEAFRYLNKALDGGGYRKLLVWMQDDPDLAYLRSATSEWDAVKERDDTKHRASPVSEVRALTTSLAVAIAAVAAVAAVLAFPWLWFVLLAGSVLCISYTLLVYLWREKSLIKLIKKLPPTTTTA